MLELVHGMRQQGDLGQRHSACDTVHGASWAKHARVCVCACRSGDTSLALRCIAVHHLMHTQVVDEAKKRAVGQNVDYDTFKNMVSVAHLRPIGAANTRAQGACVRAQLP